MFLRHWSAALFAKRWLPQVSLGHLFFLSVLPDVVFAVLALCTKQESLHFNANIGSVSVFGSEQSSSHVEDGATGAPSMARTTSTGIAVVFPFDFEFPHSHNLVIMTLLALVFVPVYVFLCVPPPVSARHYTRWTYVGLILLASPVHWMLDLVFHRAGMEPKGGGLTLVPSFLSSSSSFYGLAVWDNIILTFVLEAGVLSSVGLYTYATSTRRRPVPLTVPPQQLLQQRNASNNSERATVADHSSAATLTQRRPHTTTSASASTTPKQHNGASSSLKQSPSSSANTKQPRHLSPPTPKAVVHHHLSHLATTLIAFEAGFCFADFGRVARLMGWLIHDERGVADAAAGGGGGGGSARPLTMVYLVILFIVIMVSRMADDVDLGREVIVGGSSPISQKLRQRLQVNNKEDTTSRALATECPEGALPTITPPGRIDA